MVLVCGNICGMCGMCSICSICSICSMFFLKNLYYFVRVIRIIFPGSHFSTILTLRGIAVRRRGNC